MPGLSRAAPPRHLSRSCGQMRAGAGVTLKPRSLMHWMPGLGRCEWLGLAQLASWASSAFIPCSLHVSLQGSGSWEARLLTGWLMAPRANSPRQTRSCLVFSHLGLEVRSCLCSHTQLTLVVTKAHPLSRGRDIDFLMVRALKHLQTYFKTTSKVTINHCQKQDIFESERGCFLCIN